LIFVVSDIFAEDVNNIKIKELIKKNQKQSETIRQQRIIINYLTKLCEKAKIKYDLTVLSKPPQKSFEEQIIYRGKERTIKWFNRIYKHFAKKYTLDDNGECIRKKPLKTFTQRCIRFRILSAISDSEVIIIDRGFTIKSKYLNFRSSDIIYHVYDTNRQFVDDDYFPSNWYLIETGVYQYTAASGATKTIKSFRVYRPELVTKEKFAEALAGGLELYNERKIGKTLVR